VTVGLLPAAVVFCVRLCTDHPLEYVRLRKNMVDVRMTVVYVCGCVCGVCV